MTPPSSPCKRCLATHRGKQRWSALVSAPTLRLVKEGHCCLLVDTMSLSQHFHIVGYALLSRRRSCSRAHPQPHSRCCRRRGPMLRTIRTGCCMKIEVVCAVLCDRRDAGLQWHEVRAALGLSPPVTEGAVVGGRCCAGRKNVGCFLKRAKPPPLKLYDKGGLGCLRVQKRSDADQDLLTPRVARMVTA